MNENMWFLSMLSFAVGLWATGNILEYWVLKKVCPQRLTYIMVAAWTTFAWSRGLFAS